MEILVVDGSTTFNFVRGTQKKLQLTLHASQIAIGFDNYDGPR